MPFSTENPDILPPLFESNLIFLGPGSPSYVVRQLSDSLAWKTILALHRLGKTLVLASAAAVAISRSALPVYEIFKVGEDPHWKPGLNLLTPYGLNLAVVPHWNNLEGGAELDTSRCFMGKARFEQLIQMLPRDTVIVGIDELTALVFDFASGLCRVQGREHVHILREGRAFTFAKNETFPLSQLGPFHLPDLDPTIPEAIYASIASAVKNNQSVLEEDIPEPPDEILTLVQLRQLARAAKDWTQSDQLRQQIASFGWRVVDTPQGATLEKQKTIEPAP